MKTYRRRREWESRLSHRHLKLSRQLNAVDLLERLLFGLGGRGVAGLCTEFCDVGFQFLDFALWGGQVLVCFSCTCMCVCVCRFVRGSSVSYPLYISACAYVNVNSVHMSITCLFICFRCTHLFYAYTHKCRSSSMYATTCNSPYSFYQIHSLTNLCLHAYMFTFIYSCPLPAGPRTLSGLSIHARSSPQRICRSPLWTCEPAGHGPACMYVCMYICMYVHMYVCM